jgi:hypothetical protein
LSPQIGSNNNEIAIDNSLLEKLKLHTEKAQKLKINQELEKMEKMIEENEALEFDLMAEMNEIDVEESI